MVYVNLLQTIYTKLRADTLHFYYPYGSMILKNKSGFAIPLHSTLNSVSAPFYSLTSLSISSPLLFAIARIPARDVEMVRFAVSDSDSL